MVGNNLDDNSGFEVYWFGPLGNEDHKGEVFQKVKDEFNIDFSYDEWNNLGELKKTVLNTLGFK
jgi:hypothetical protein